MIASHFHFRRKYGIIAAIVGAHLVFASPCVGQGMVRIYMGEEAELVMRLGSSFRIKTGQQTDPHTGAVIKE